MTFNRLAVRWRLHLVSTSFWIFMRMILVFVIYELNFLEKLLKTAIRFENCNSTTKKQPHILRATICRRALSSFEPYSNPIHLSDLCVHVNVNCVFVRCEIHYGILFH